MRSHWVLFIITTFFIATKEKCHILFLLFRLNRYIFFTYQAALQELLQFITDTLGLSPTQISAWNKIANLIASVIEERMKEFQ